jgi:sulfoxide reductase heme-binding subunit YedZ
MATATTPVTRKAEPTAKQPWLQPAVFVGALIPLVVLGVRAERGTLGADPIAIALNQLGLLALIALVASLLATPVRLLFRVNWPIRIRRLVGLLSFGYATLHLLLYVVVDQGMQIGVLVADVTKRPFIMLGAAAYLVLVPLAATSSARMVKRLGARRWKRLHRLTYLAGLLALAHFVVRVKRDLSEPLVYGVVLGVALLLRTLPSRQRPQSSTRV